jgi:hypothetical protein
MKQLYLENSTATISNVSSIAFDTTGQYIAAVTTYSVSLIKFSAYDGTIIDTRWQIEGGYNDLVYPNSVIIDSQGNMVYTYTSFDNVS